MYSNGEDKLLTNFFKLIYGFKKKKEAWPTSDSKGFVPLPRNINWFPAQKAVVTYEKIIN
jgi:hypothetical protein